MITLRFLCLWMFYYEASCCTQRNPKIAGNAFQRLVGNDIVQSPCPNHQGQAATTSKDLSCSAISSGSCCWLCSSSVDQLPWMSLSGTAEPAKMQRSFGTKNMPNGEFFGVASDTGVKGVPKTAHLYSCPIKCSSGPVTITLRHWHTKDVRLHVCDGDEGDASPSNCKPLGKKSGLPETVQFPGGANKRITILAEGFTEKKGSVAMIDDITTDFTCGQAELVTKSPTPACQKITCNFEDGNPCSYKNAQSAGGSKSFDVVKIPYMNPLTGVPTAASGSNLAGTYLNPGDSAVLATDVAFPENSIVQFFWYRATEGVDLLACCGSTGNCPFSTSTQVQVSDYRNWKPSTITCPKGTSKVLFQAKNSGKNQGAVGLDNIHLLFPGGGPEC